MPVDAQWFSEFDGLVCENDGDCFGATYAGRCQTKVCCDESYHGSGDCDCKAENILVQNQKKALKVITNYRLRVTFVLVMIGLPVNQTPFVLVIKAHVNRHLPGLMKPGRAENI